MVEPHGIDETVILGVDCAVDPRRVGLASAVCTDGGLRRVEVLAPQNARQMVEWLAERVRGAGRALLAIDSPLGWPAPLGAALAGHRAGVPIPAAADALFRRATDRFVREQIGKQPLEVGADRIARTAVAALRLLGELGSLFGAPIPLAWAPERLPRISAIETYPAAWLLGRRLPASAYKDSSPDASARREAIISSIRPQVSADGGSDAATLRLMRGSSHLLDGVVCLLCAVDFLRGRCFPPPNPELAAVEGWIWFARPA